MASRHYSLNMSEVADVTDMMVAFETHDKVRVKIDMEVVDVGKGPDLRLTAKAIGMSSESTEAPLLASVSVRCSTMNLKHLSAALTHLMYTLDFQLAANEYLSARDKKT